MHKLLFFVIKKFPRVFSLIGIKDLQPDKVDTRDDVMGQADPRFAWKTLKEDMDWTKNFKGTDLEVQKYMDCTGYGIKAILQCLYLEKWGINIKLSAAYINACAGTSKWKGNGLRTVLNSVNKYGWVTDDEWPEEKRFVKSVPQSVIDKGKARRAKYDFGYDLVLPTRKGLQTGLLYSPLYGGGYGWGLKGGVYWSWGKANHCFILLKDLISRLAGDSYKPHVKELAYNYRFQWPRRVYLERKNKGWNKDQINKYLNDGVLRIMRVHNNGEVWEMNKDGALYKSKENYLTERAKDDFKNGTMIPMSEEDWANKMFK